MCVGRGWGASCAGAPGVGMATVVISHTAHAFPFGQLDVVAGEQVEVVERFDSGWWEVKKADGAHQSSALPPGLWCGRGACSGASVGAG